MMASSKVSFLIVCFVVAICAAADLTDGANAPSSSVDCSSIVTNLIDCLSFVKNDSTLTKPEGKCCSGLKTVLKTAPSSCLCDTFKKGPQFGIALNLTKALTLPAACKLVAPSLTDCGLTEAPAVAPVGSLSPHTSLAPVNEPSAAPAPRNAGSALLPISAGPLFVFLFALFLSGF